MVFESLALLTRIENLLEIRPCPRTRADQKLQLGHERATWPSTGGCAKKFHFVENLICMNGSASIRLTHNLQLFMFTRKYTLVFILIKNFHRD